ncbi:MAG: hypothetical protein ACLFQJ_05200 [Campylobacterales bacterium]
MTYLVVALKVEALPLIRAFGLKLDNSHPFEIYKSNSVELIISGVGGARASQALTYIYTINKSVVDNNSFFLNIGTAGSSFLGVGEAFLASSIKQDGAKKVFYPDNLFSKTIKKAELTSSIAPAVVSDKNSNYDQEAYGFSEACESLLYTHQFGIFKIISDNLDDRSFKKEFINEIFSKHTETISNYIEAVQERFDFEILGHKERKDIKNLSEKLGFSFSQQVMFNNYAKYYKINQGDFAKFLDNYAKIGISNKHNRNKIFSDVRQFLLT